MAVCPNKRLKRAGKGGGTPGCDGEIEMTVMVPVTIRIKRQPKGGETLEDIVLKGEKKAHKIHWATLKKAILSGKATISCNQCGWSLSNLFAGLSRTKNKR